MGIEYAGCNFMNVLANNAGQQAFVRQAAKCRATGSAFVADVLDAVDRQLAHAPLISSMVLGWAGDPAADALALRVNGALHALARQGKPAYLAALYDREHDDFNGAIAAALSQEETFIAQ